MQIIYSERPPNINLDELIDISSSLEYILELEDNNSILIRNLSLKTAFLVVLVTAYQPLDLHRINILSCCQVSSGYIFDCYELKEYKIAKTHSLSTLKSRIKRIFLEKYQENSQLYPYKAVKILLLRTQ